MSVLCAGLYCVAVFKHDLHSTFRYSQQWQIAELPTSALSFDHHVTLGTLFSSLVPLFLCQKETGTGSTLQVGHGAHMLKSAHSKSTRKPDPRTQQLLHGSLVGAGLFFILCTVLGAEDKATKSIMGVLAVSISIPLHVGRVKNLYPSTRSPLLASLGVLKFPRGISHTDDLKSYPCGVWYRIRVPN